MKRCVTTTHLDVLGISQGVLGEHTLFKSVEESWGVHSVDCFASYYNKEVGKFFSRFWNPGCSEVDFFVQNLEGENCLVVPPVSLIARAIHYLHVSKAIATTVVPF